jgi:high-affinity nickel-transport protein
VAAGIDTITHGDLTASALLMALAGLIHGARHAFEPDHVAAVSTFVASKRSPMQSFRFAGAWGLGHACTLLLLGGSLVAFGWHLPDRAATGLELFVASVLIALGIRSVIQAKRIAESGPEQAHAHWFKKHQHAFPGPHLHVGKKTFATLPFVVGLVHGLAGSGALAALVSTTMPTRTHALLYVGLYGIGAAAAMAAVGALVAKPLGAVLRTPYARRICITLSGLASMGIGLAWGALAAWG